MGISEREDKVESDDKVSESKLTLKELKALVPKHMRRNISESTVKTINKLTMDDDEEAAIEYKDNFISYISILKNSKYRITDYANAVKFVGYRLMERTVTEAYRLTFPHRYARLLENYKHLSKEQRDKNISGFCSAYNTKPLVNAILDQALIPAHLYNAFNFQKAINVQVDLMLHGRSEAVRQKAADSLMTHLKPPEAQRIELNVTTRESDALKEMQDTLNEIALKGKDMIAAGQTDLQQLGSLKISDTVKVIDAEIEENTDEDKETG